MKDSKIKGIVKDRYSKAAKRRSCCGSTSGPSGSELKEKAKEIGYSQAELDSIPQASVMGLGCGNPTALANLKKGEIVLDLGSGAGIDVFLAANKVGPEGRVIGVDMTEEMISRSRKLAEESGYKNVEFKLGDIEDLPIDDNSIDVIISNCVINLSPDKLKTFQEAFRVLKPGGRILISDLVTEEKLPEEVRENPDAWAACIAGALVKGEYLDIIKNAGFKDIRIVSQETSSDPKLGKITSVKVEAYKRM